MNIAAILYKYTNIVVRTFDQMFLFNLSSIPKEHYTETCDAVQDDYFISGSEGGMSHTYNIENNCLLGATK